MFVLHVNGKQQIDMELDDSSFLCLYNDVKQAISISVPFTMLVERSLGDPPVLVEAGSWEEVQIFLKGVPHLVITTTPTAGVTRHQFGRSVLSELQIRAQQLAGWR